MDVVSLSARVKEMARSAGMDVVRITHAQPFEGYAMTSSRRRDPSVSMPGARSIVVVGVYIGGFGLPAWESPTVGRTSRLFLSGFFADVVAPLEPVAEFLRGEGFRAMVCDTFQSETSILPLKLAAVRAGIGWQGKNTLVVSRDYGSFLALGAILTDAPLVLDDGPPERGRCGECDACVRACPMGALDDPYRLDRGRCMSSLLELEGPLGDDLHSRMGTQVVECDTCQTVCPWNRRHVQEALPTARTLEFRARDNLARLASLFEFSNLCALTPKDYEEHIGRYRSGISYEVFRRNTVAALAHAPAETALPLLELARSDPDPVVRRTAEASVAKVRAAALVKRAP